MIRFNLNMIGMPGKPGRMGKPGMKGKNNRIHLTNDYIYSKIHVFFFKHSGEQGEQGSQVHANNNANASAVSK